MQMPKTNVLEWKYQKIKNMVFAGGKKAQNSKKSPEIKENI